jgi:hypothetical protein
VEVNNSYSGTYRYVSTSEFYISSISPIVGTSGTLLTLKGNNLNMISKVEVGGKECTSPGLTTIYTCTLPDNPPGEVDIIITLTDGKIYRFAKVFEYEN